MKHISKSERIIPLPPLLAFGAHPDDVEFGCGGALVKEALAGRKVHVVVCSKGEAGSHGTARQRVAEAKKGAREMGATVEFVALDGDAHLEVKAKHAIKLAAIIRRVRPGIVLAPTVVENQHPDHWRLGKLVRDAARLARYGGLRELKRMPPHAIGQLFFYAVTAGAEPRNQMPVLVNVQGRAVAAWVAAMEAFATQAATRDYVELAITRARVHGLAAGVGHAIPLFPNDPIVVESLEQIQRAARAF